MKYWVFQPVKSIRSKAALNQEHDQTRGQRGAEVGGQQAARCRSRRSGGSEGPSRRSGGSQGPRQEARRQLGVMQGASSRRQLGVMQEARGQLGVMQEARRQLGVMQEARRQLGAEVVDQEAARGRSRMRGGSNGKKQKSRLVVVLAHVDSSRSKVCTVVGDTWYYNFLKYTFRLVNIKVSMHGVLRATRGQMLSQISQGSMLQAA